MVFVASLPGAVVLVGAWVRGARSGPSREPQLPGRLAVVARRDGAPDA